MTDAHKGIILTAGHAQKCMKCERGKEKGMKENYLMDAKDIMKEFGIGRNKAYEIIKSMNMELLKEGYEIISGKIPRPYVEKKFYGFNVMTT